MCPTLRGGDVNVWGVQIFSQTQVLLLYLLYNIPVLTGQRCVLPCVGDGGGGGGGGGGGAPAQLVRVVRDGAWPDAWLSEQRLKGYIVSHLAVMCSGTTAAAAAPRYGAAPTRRAAPPSGISALVLTRMHTANAGRRHPGAGALVQEVKQLSDFTSLAMLSSDFQHYTMVSMSKVQLGPEGLCTSVCSSADAEFLVKQVGSNTLRSNTLRLYN